MKARDNVLKKATKAKLSLERQNFVMLRNRASRLKRREKANFFHYHTYIPTIVTIRKAYGLKLRSIRVKSLPPWNANAITSLKASKARMCMGWTFPCWKSVSAFSQRKLEIMENCCSYSFFFKGGDHSLISNQRPLSRLPTVSEVR